MNHHFVDEVKKSHIKVKIILGQVERKVEHVKVFSYEKLKSDWKQTWFIDKMLDHLYVHAAKGHIPRSKSSQVKLKDQLKMWNSPRLKS